MKNVVGPPARGDNFYPRKKEVRKIIDSLKNGNNIQITAPRRVGKTSILWYLFDTDQDNRCYVYVDTESVASAQDFFKKLLQEIVRHDHISSSSKLRSVLKSGANRFWGKIKTIKILNSSVEFSQETQTVDYFEDLQNFLLGYAQEESKELVILIDEFPQTIENIKERSITDAMAFLLLNHEIRTKPETAGKIQFIYTGSISLNQTVSRINASATIGDLNSIEVNPLAESEAKELFSLLLYPYDRNILPDAVGKLLEIIQWYIPFHIQLIVQEIVQQTGDGDEISADVVTQSVNSIITLKNQNHFDHYYTRLKVQFKGEAFGYADELLKYIAENDTADKTKALDLSVKYNVTAEYRRILETLMHDGYVHYADDSKVYRFNSPIVKRWWQKFIC